MESKRAAGRLLVEQLGRPHLGGEAALQAIRTIQTEGMGHNYALEQSERPEGPVWTSA